MNASSITIEVLPYKEAPWAPGQDLGSFRWAWRVIGHNQNVVTGAHTGTKARAEAAARLAVKKMKEYARRPDKGVAWRNFQISDKQVPTNG